MKNNFYLLSIRFKGIKNIEKEVNISFYKKTTPKDFSSKGYNVKAIYGENGSGKTAIVTAVDLFKKVLLKENYLNSAENQGYFDEIINKKTNSFSFTCEMLDCGKYVYIYSISIKKSESGNYFISHESLAMRSRTGKKESLIYECNDGKLSTIHCKQDTEAIIREKSANLLKSTTLLMCIFSNIFEFPDIEGLKPFLRMFLSGYYIQTYLDQTDQHELYFLSQKINSIQSRSNQTVNEIIQGISYIKHAIPVDAKYIHTLDFEEYEQKIRRLEAFLKIFKPDLNHISIDRKIYKEYYQCELILNYDGYSISQEFESTGIRRLIDLFDDFNLASNGHIVFIDEMDANINDVYLCKLVEFFMEYGDGQLCFTTHNTSPMNILRRNKNSIDFLSNDNRIIPWKTNGNYSPASLYHSGMIQYLPFNIESTDFIGILGGGENE